MVNHLINHPGFFSNNHLSFISFSIVRNSSDQKPPLVAENPVSKFLLSNQEAKTVLNQRVKRQWSEREEERNEYYEPEHEAWEAELESEYYDKRKGSSPLSVPSV